MRRAHRTRRVHRCSKNAAAPRALQRVAPRSCGPLIIAIDEVSTLAAPQPQVVYSQLTLAYHRQALRRATVLFWLSVVGVIVVFGWVIYVSLIAPAAINTVLKILSGTVSLLLFRQANQARKHATELYDRLRKDGQQAQAVAITAMIDDARLRNQIRAQLALQLAGITTLAAEATKGAAQEQAVIQLAEQPPAARRIDSG